MDIEFLRGDVVVCVLQGDYGKPRPAIVVQSDLFNATHASITLCPVTTHLVDAPLFRLPLFPNEQNGLQQPSQIMIDKITTLRADKLHKKMGVLTQEQCQQVNHALQVWLGFV